MTANELLARFSEQQVAALLPGPRPRLAAVPPRAAVLVQDDPGARARDRRRRRSPSASMPVVKHGAIDLDPLAFGGLIVKEVLVGLAFAFALAAMFAAPAGRRLAARHADRLLVRRAGRPGHRQPVGGPRPALLAVRRRDLRSRSAATPGSSRASPAPTTRCRCSTRRPSARSSGARRSRSRASSSPRS